MKGATPNEKQLEKNKNDPHMSKEQTAKASRENIHQAKKSWKRARIICEDSESRTSRPGTGRTARGKQEWSAKL